MSKENLEKEANDMLIQRLLIENRNIEYCATKIQKEGRTLELWTLFETFKQNYQDIYDEIIRRMEHASKKRK